MRNKNEDVKPCSVFYIDSEGNKQCLNPPLPVKVFKFGFWLFRLVLFIITLTLVTVSVGGIK